MSINHRFKLGFNTDFKTNLTYILKEVFIISLGVLVAIGLNNWNEERKLKTEECNFLKSFSAVMLSDSIDYDSNISGAEEWVKDISRIIKFTKGVGLDTDSLNFESAGFSYIYAVPTSLGMYEELKGKGLSFIKDDTLRNLITQYYESELTNCRTTEEHFSMIREDLRAYYSQNFTSWSDPEAVPLDIEKVKNDKLYVNLIEQKQERLNYLSYINSTLIHNVSQIRLRICKVYGYCD